MTGSLDPRLRKQLMEFGEPLARSEPGVGSDLGHCRLLRKIGQGGMGTVYEAEDTRLKRRVAVKVLRDIVSDRPQMRERFFREAEAIARLQHPGIATIHEIGEDQGRLFLVMELLGGPTLAERLASGPRDTRELLALLEKVALAIHRAHEKGVLHRDLKPGNILLTESGEPKVADFGLAHMTDAGVSLPGASGMVGTPSYMSPEQVTGDRSALSAATDVYALGAILFEILTGRTPFHGSTPMEIGWKTVHADVPSPRNLRPDVDRDLEAVCLRAMEKDPALRYPSAAEFANDVRRHLEGRPVRARPATPLHRIRKLLRRRRRTVAAVLGGGMLVAAFTAVLLTLLGHAEQRRAELDEVLRLWRDIARLETDAEALARKGEVARAGQLLDRGAAKCAAFLRSADSPLVRYFLARLHAAAGRSGEALRELDRAIEAKPGFPEAKLERGLLRVAEYGRRMRSYSRATWEEFGWRGLREAPTVREIEARHADLGELKRRIEEDLSVDGADSPYVSEERVMFARAELDRVRGSADDARELLEDMVRRGWMPARAHLSLARIAMLERDWKEAVRLTDLALEEHRGLAAAYMLRSQARFFLDQLSEAEEDRKGILEDASRAIEYGERSAEAYLSRGTAFAHLSDTDAAIEDFRKAIELEPDYPMAHNNLGVALIRKKDGDGALASCRRAVELNPFQPLFHFNLGAAMKLKGDLAGAIGEYDRALELRPGYADAFHERGVAHRQLGNLDAALADFDRFVALRPSKPWPLILRAGVRFLRGDFDRGILDCTEALRLQPEAAVARRLRGDIWREKGEHGKAEADLDEAVRLKPENPDNRFSRALLFLRLSRLDEAREDAEAAMAAAPDWEKPYILRGEIRLRSGDLPGALEDLNRAVDLVPDSADAYGQRATIRVRLKDLDGAHEDYSKAIRLAPRKAANYYNRGALLLSLKRLGEAMEDLRRAEELAPVNSPVWRKSRELQARVREGLPPPDDQ